MTQLRLRLSCILWLGLTFGAFSAQAQTEQSLDQTVSTQFYRSVAATELDNRCDVLTREGRLALMEVQSRVESLLLSVNRHYTFDKTRKTMQADARRQLKPGCESYRTDLAWSGLAKLWNDHGLTQLATLSDPDIRASCRLNTDSHAYLRSESDRAMAELTKRADQTVLQSLQQRMTYHRAQCRRRQSFFVPQTNVGEVVGELPTTYMLLRRNGLTDGRAVRFHTIHGRRDVADERRAEAWNDGKDYPYRLHVTREGGLHLVFKGGERPKGESLAALSASINGEHHVQRLKSETGDVWVLSPEEVTALLEGAKSFYKPSIKFYLETWEEALNGGGGIFIGALSPDGLEQALDYADYETP